MSKRESMNNKTALMFDLSMPTLGKRHIYKKEEIYEIPSKEFINNLLIFRNEVLNGLTKKGLLDLIYSSRINKIWKEHLEEKELKKLKKEELVNLILEEIEELKLSSSTHNTDDIITILFS